MDGDGVLAGHDEVGGIGAGGERRQVGHPPAVIAGGRADRLAAEGDGDRIGWAGAAPDWDRLAALQHGVVAEQRRERDLGVGCGTGSRRDARADKP